MSKDVGSAEEARRSELKLGAIEQVLIAADTAGIVTSWNAAAERLYHWSADKAIGRPLAQLTVPATLRHQCVASHPPPAVDLPRTRADRLLSVLDQSSLVVMAFDASGTLTLAEGRGLAACGVHGAGLLGASLADLKAAQPGAAEAIERALAGEAGVVTLDVAERRIDLRCQPDVDAAGRIVGVTVVGSDVTDRVGAVERAERRESRWGSLVSQSADVAVIGDGGSGALTFVSPNVTRLFGWQPAELCGRQAMSLVHAADVDRVAKAFAIVANDAGAHGTVEFRLACADGSYRWVEETISNLTNLPGVEGFVGNIRDISSRRDAEEKLAQRERLTRALAAKASEVAKVVGLDGYVRYRNPSASSVVVAAEGDTVDFTRLDYVHADDRALVRAAMGSLAEPDATARMTYRRIGTDGQWRWVEEVITNCVNDPDIRGLVVNVREITEQVEARAALGVSEARYRLIAETAQEGIWATDSDGGTLYANQKMADLLGRELSAFYANPVWKLLTGSTKAGFGKRLRRREEQNCTDRYDLRHIRPDGSKRILAVSVSPFVEKDRRLGSLAMVSDITDAREAEQKLRHRATHDPLTGVANRNVLVERLRQLLNIPGSDASSSVAVLVADIDQFKLVNDSLGHSSGDDMLIEVSRRWQAVLRPQDVLARFGGDEFVVMCVGAGESTARDIASRLLQTLEEPIKLGGRLVAATASIGIAVVSAGGTGDAESLLGYADRAMYEAKARGRNRTELFTPALIERSLSRLQLFSDLKTAIAQDLLAVHYQPVVELATGKLLGVEALCRRTHPQRGAIAPDEFIAAAEAGGLIEALDSWVLRRACRDAVALRSEGVLKPETYLAVNASAHSLANPEYLSRVSAALNDTGLPAQSLVLEVTESAVMTDPDAAQRLLEALQALRVRIAIDDFGTGYSSLAYLRRFPVSTLKVDRSFVKHIRENGEDLAIVTAVIDLANALNLTTTAEGIETADDLALLQQLGCLAGQGFLWSPGLPPEQLTALIGHLPNQRFTVARPARQHAPIPLPPPRSGTPPLPDGLLTI